VTVVTLAGCGVVRGAGAVVTIAGADTCDAEVVVEAVSELVPHDEADMMAKEVMDTMIVLVMVIESFAVRAAVAARRDSSRPPCRTNHTSVVTAGPYWGDAAADPRQVVVGPMRGPHGCDDSHIRKRSHPTTIRSQP